MRKLALFVICAFAACMFSACGVPPDAALQSNAPADEPTEEADIEGETKLKLYVQAGSSTFAATLEDNATAEAFAARLAQAPAVVRMSDYAGFEKVGSLGMSLPANDAQMTTSPGDIVLYNGDRIVVFYGSNTWSYTRIARIDDLTGWTQALGGGDVTITFSIGG
ncbi:MAG: cyclophilin-like fold protein [Clostridia bacterium]|nr:cyclophilin-like fold protein [Clostridia bacterium]